MVPKNSMYSTVIGIWKSLTWLILIYSIRAPSPPPKKRKREDEEEEEEIPHILQGEIARLGSRFRVSLDPTQHSSSKDVHLVCKIGTVYIWKCECEINRGLRLHILVMLYWILNHIFLWILAYLSQRLMSFSNQILIGIKIHNENCKRNPRITYM